MPALPPWSSCQPWGTVLSSPINEEIGLEVSLPRSLLRVIHAHVKSKKCLFLASVFTKSQPVVL